MTDFSQEFAEKFNFHVTNCNLCKQKLLAYSNSTMKHNHPVCNCGSQPVHLNHEECKDCQKLWNSFVSTAMKDMGKYMMSEGLKNALVSIKRKINWRH